jgi:arylsulfatase
METIDEEVLSATQDFLGRAKKSDKPFFCWFNTTRMHNFTHVKEENLGKTGLGFYADGMVEHDALVGKLLKTVDDLGLDKNTIVIYTTDNGPMVCLYPDAGTTPFRGEKNTNWEGGWRVPAMIRWPGVVKPGTKFTDIVAGEDWLPTILAAAGDSKIKEELLKGHKAGDKNFKVHLDGYNQIDYLSGKSTKGKRDEFFYFSDDGDLLALRYQRLKIHFMIQEATGIDVWRRPFTTLRAPIFFDLEVDPFERGQEGMGYNDWWYRRSYMAVPIQNIVGKTLMTFKEFPPRQKPASFTIDQAMEALTRSTSPGSK